MATVADDVTGWIRQHAAPAGATVHAHRQPADFGAADVVLVALERQTDSYLLGGGPGFGLGGESEIRIGLWWVINRRRPTAQRPPARWTACSLSTRRYSAFGGKPSAACWFVTSPRGWPQCSAAPRRRTRSSPTRA